MIIVSTFEVTNFFCTFIYHKISCKIKISQSTNLLIHLNRYLATLETLDKFSMKTQLYKIKLDKLCLSA